MLLLINDNVENTEIEIYFRYRHLDTGEIATLFTRLDKLYQRLLSNSYPVYYSDYYGAPFRNFLEIDSINTGQSIRIRFKEGWKPEFNLRKQELEIRIPKNLGIPAILLYLLLTGVQKFSSSYNQYLDGQLKELEIELKQLELFDKIQNRERSGRSLIASPYQRQANETIQTLINNQNISYIEINGSVIKTE